MPVNQREIKIPYAFKNGAWIHISQVENGLKANCVCPCCNKSLLAKKGTKVTHHFAHYKKADCQPETVLHFIAKNFLHQKIERHLNENLPLNVSWLCKFCEKKHQANLLRRAKKAYLEYKLGDCRPDIALLTENDKPVAVIEIVMTHKPENSAMAYYQKNKIAVDWEEFLIGHHCYRCNREWPCRIKKVREARKKAVLEQNSPQNYLQPNLFS